MDKIAAYNFLLARHPLWEKQASLLPVGTALGGGVLGGIGGAMSTDNPAERKKRALMGAVGGGIMGGLGGEVYRRGGVIDLLNKDKSNMAQELSRKTDEATRADELFRSKVTEVEDLSDEIAGLNDELAGMRNTNQRVNDELAGMRDINKQMRQDLSHAQNIENDLRRHAKDLEGWAARRQNQAEYNKLMAHRISGLSGDSYRSHQAHIERSFPLEFSEMDKYDSAILEYLRNLPSPS